MTVAYHNSRENEPTTSELEELEHQNVGKSETKSEVSAVSQEFKTWRRQFQEITTRMRQASDIDTLLQVTVAQVRAKIGGDRVLIYRFTSLEAGTVLSESRSRGWTPTLNENLPGILFGLYTSTDYLEAVAINDIDQGQLTPYQKQLLEKFQIKSSLSLPIIVGGKVWGLLAINNCASMRQWQESETTLLSQISTELTYRLQSFEYQKESQQQILAKKSVAKVIDKILQVSSLDKIFQTTTQEIRQLLRCDRVGVYRFEPDWSGKFVAESVAEGWIKMVTPDFKMVWEDSHLQETKGGRYAKGESFAVNDIYQMGHAQCHIDILEQFDMKAYMIVPIFSGEQLWGLLAAYQNTGPREWQSWQVNFLTQIGLQFGVAISQGEYLEQVQLKSEQLVQIVDQEKALTKTINRIRQALDVESFFKTTTQEVRQSLRCDRVAVYRFNPDWGGQFIAESVGNNWIKLVGADYKMVLDDTYLQETQGGRYAKSESFVVNDIYTIGHAPCHIEILEQLEAKAYMIVPIFFGDQLWGLLAAYQNSGSREWQPWELNFLTQIGLQFSLAKSQIDYLDKLRQQSAKIAQSVEQEKAFSKIVNQIRQSLTSGIDEIFKSTTQDIRQLFKCDRCAVYKFTSDWGGHFISESVATGWIKLVTPEHKTAFDDPCLQALKGGDYKKGSKLIVSDIYQASFDTCYIEILEGFEAKAYAIVPILFGEKLWGLLAVYQNSSTREWQESETNLLARIGDQLGLALQQTEFLQQLQAQSAKLSEAAGREKAAKELLQQRSIQLLTALRPALDGDLTVRAPITEDELGTIADAYNNTLQALRQIVIQVQSTSQKVAQTSSTSDASLAGLTNLAKQQSQEITTALNDIQQMVDSTQAVVANADLVQVAVQKANQTVESGDAAMNQTVQAIQAIRETVAQTSKKIKRLTESSQKISRVVNLISNFATQTNVLALNAAIEATRAGEYGKGFAVVADEVRSLSRQSAAATIEIEKLVQEIQSETGEVAVAMETGIQQVVEGTNFVSETRQNLNEIVSATADISQLIEQITAATQKQMGQSVTVTASMKDVAAIANQTFTESQEIAAVLQDLSGMAQGLLATASKFKVN
ncbi:GAF domain-containing protein [Anabaena sp. CCY 0017]|uniref:GAF domain-containing protein n=1 Tax=Anabaena sp. CCY 0017 TaxID=3103866 RepID=UPI0039C6AF70